MQKLQTKVSKALNEYVRENQRKKDAQVLKEVHERSKNVTSVQQPLLEGHVCYCCYCSKAFNDSHFLMKHMFRRHCSELLGLHRQLLKDHQPTRKESNQSHTRCKSAPVSLEKELFDIKKMLRDFKLEIFEQLKFLKLNYQIGDTTVNTEREAMFRFSKHQKSQNEENQRFYNELQELKLQCQNSEIAVRKLEELCKSSHDSLKADIALKEENRVRSNVETQKMIRNALKTQKKEISVLREELEKQVIVTHQALCSELQKQNSAWENKLIKLEERQISNFEKLQSFVELNFEKLENAQDTSNCEEKFERILQDYLKKISKNSKRKHESSNLSHANVLVDPYVISDITSPQKVPNDQPGPSHSKNRKSTPKKLLDSSQQRQKTDKTVKVAEKPNATSKQPVSVKKNKSPRPLFITKRIKAAVQQNPDILEAIYEETSNALDNKLQDYGIDPNQNSLSTVEFEAKRKLLQNEIHSLSCGRQGFLNLRNEINNLVTEKAQSYTLQNKKEKRITFASPEVSFESHNIDDSVSKKEEEELEDLNELSWRESSGFNVGDLKSPEEVVEIHKSKLLSPILVLPQNQNKKEGSFNNNDQSSQLISQTSREAINISQAEGDHVRKPVTVEHDVPSSTNSSLSAVQLFSDDETAVEILNSFGQRPARAETTKVNSLFVRRELKFENDRKAPSQAHDVEFLSDKFQTLKSDEISDIDSKSSLESLSDWSEFDDKINK